MLYEWNTFIRFSDACWGAGVVIKLGSADGGGTRDNNPPALVVFGSFGAFGILLIVSVPKYCTIRFLNRNWNVQG